MPVEAGGLRTRWGVSETNRVPWSRSSRTLADRRLGGWAVRASGNSGGFPTAEPLNRLSARLPTTRPPTLKAHFTAGLLGSPRTAVRTRETRRVRRRFVGFSGTHVPEYNPKPFRRPPPVARCSRPAPRPTRAGVPTSNRSAWLSGPADRWRSDPSRRRTALAAPGILGRVPAGANRGAFSVSGRARKRSTR